MSRGIKVIRGSATKIVGLILGVAISFYMMPFLVKSLGDRMYGLWTLVGSILGYYSLMDIGLSSAVVRFISRAVGQNSVEEIKKNMSTSFYLFSGLGCIVILSTFVLTASLGFWIKNPEDLKLFRILILFMGINFGLDFPVRTFNAVFSANLREDIGTGISIVKALFVTVFIVVAIKKGYGIIGLCAITVIFSLLDSLTRIILAYQVEPSTTVHFRHFDSTKIKPLFGYSFYTFIGKIATILKFRLDQLVVSTFVSLSSVTHYFVAQRLIEYLTEFIQQMISVVSPVFSQDESRNDYDAIRKKFLFMIKLSVYISAFFGGAILLNGKNFIVRWMGRDYLDSYTVLCILLGSMLVYLIQMPVNPLLYGISKHRYKNLSDLVEGVLNLVCSLWLVRIYGMIGVALGTAIPMVFIGLIVQPWYACKSIELESSIYWGVLLRNVLIATLCLGAGWLVTFPFAKPTYPSLIFCVTTMAVIYWPLVARFGLIESERALLYRVIKGALGYT